MSRLDRKHCYDLVVVRIDNHDLVLIDEVQEPAPPRLYFYQRLGHRHHVDLAARDRRADPDVEVDVADARRIAPFDHSRLDLRALLLVQLHIDALGRAGATAAVDLRAALIALGAALRILGAALHVVLRRLLRLVRRIALGLRLRALLVLVLALHGLRGVAAQALQGVLPLGLPVGLRAAIHLLLVPGAALAHPLRFLTARVFALFAGLRGPIGVGFTLFLSLGLRSRALLLRLGLGALALFLGLGLRGLTLLLRLGLRALVHGLA